MYHEYGRDAWDTKRYFSNTDSENIWFYFKSWISQEETWNQDVILLKAFLMILSNDCFILRRADLKLKLLSQLIIRNEIIIQLENIFIDFILIILKFAAKNYSSFIRKKLVYFIS